MLRPIDTQTIYQQMQEGSNRQQAYRVKEEVAQLQFADITNHEIEAKQEKVNHILKEEKVDHDLKKPNGGKDRQNKKKKNKPASKLVIKEEKQTSNTGEEVHIDIQI